MVKILFLIEKYGGGAERVLKSLVSNMDRTKYEITVQSIWPAEEWKSLSSGIRYKTVYPKKNKLTGALFRLEAAAKLAYPLHIRGRYDIECAYLEFGPTKLLAGSTNRNAVKLAWIHSDLLKITSHPEQFFEKHSGQYEKYDRIICVSQTAKESFDRLFHNRFPSVVLRNYIDEKQVLALAQEPLDIQKPDGTMVLVAVGTLYPPKNYPRLIRAFARLRQDYNRLQLWIVGDGVQRTQLEALAANCDIKDAVCFFGFQKNPYPYMRMADLLVCSSNYEGYSTVITEGLVLGKPIVTTECSGMRELLGDSEYGLITKNDDEAFTDGLRRMIAQPELLQFYSRKAIERGRLISGQHILEQTDQLFEDVLSRKDHNGGRNET